MAFRLLLFFLSFGASLSGQEARFEFHPVSREVIQERLNRFSSKSAEREKKLRELFEEAGCTGERLREQPVKGTRLPNIICTQPGETGSVIVIGGHFDFVEFGYGVVDNWSGASLLPSLFQSLRSRPRRHTFAFVGFTGEESGLVGSRLYVKQLTSEERSKTRAMLNFDCLGLSSTKVWVSRSDRKLVAMLYGVARALKLPLEGVNVELVGSDDGQSFARSKIPSISIHSVTQETFPILHTMRDSLEAMRLDDYYDTYRLVCAYLVLLDAVLD